eukprot:gene19381-15204_t
MAEFDGQPWYIGSIGRQAVNTTLLEKAANGDYILRMPSNSTSEHCLTLACRTGEGTVRNDRILLIGGEYTVERSDRKFPSVAALLEKISYMCKRPAAFLFKEQMRGGGGGGGGGGDASALPRGGGDAPPLPPP